jgi:hypothetical protein
MCSRTMRTNSVRIDLRPTYPEVEGRIYFVPLVLSTIRSSNSADSAPHKFHIKKNWRFPSRKRAEHGGDSVFYSAS